MGDPRKHRRTYSKPGKAWDAERIDKERELMREYGLRRKNEIWKAESFLRDLRKQAKNLTAKKDAQAQKESEQLIVRLVKLSLVKGGAKLEDVLGLDLKSVLDRRLQSVVLKRGLAKSMKQARQFVVHGHISIGDNKVNVPSYPVKGDEEGKIKFSGNSGLGREDHPERVKEARIIKEAKKKLEIEGKDAVELFDETKEEAPKEEVKKEEPKTEVKKEEKKVVGKKEEKPEVKKEVPKKEVKETSKEKEKKEDKK